MITRRDLLVAAITVGSTLGVVALAHSDKPLLPSTAFDWNAVQVLPQKYGARRNLFDSPTATLANLECHVTTLNPGETPHAAHRHPEEELMFVKEGTIEVLVNGELKRVGSGSVIFQTSNQLHSIKNVGSTPATYHVLKWVSPGMQKPASAIVQPVSEGKERVE